MRLFLRSKRFKVFLCIFIALAVVMTTTILIGKYASPQTSFLSVITSPFQKVSAYISEKVSGVIDNFAEADSIKKENEQLKQTISEYEEKLVDYEKMAQENANLRQFYDLKQENQDFELQDANIIARDSNEVLFKTFTIDKGTLNGISKHDPVVAQGRYLVGYVYEASPTQATVITLLNPNINISAAVNRTSDTGNVSGEVTLAEQGLCRLSGLDRNSGASAGDRVVTTELGGMFPDGLIIGTIKEIKASGSDISNYAVIEPGVDFDDIKFVMVIKDFEGQTSIGD